MNSPTLAAGGASSAVPAKKAVETAAEVKKTGAEAKGKVSGNEAAMALAKKSGCLGCHTVETKLVGPSWKDIAARYKGDSKAKATLIEKVKKGGKGNWTKVTGGVPMPPNSPKVPDADIEKLVDYVLSMAK
ncbi:MAG: c-type cytochrome [Nitrospirota bacterium]|nr:c-type cytochrome [Nitrospirota bacterium]